MRPPLLGCGLIIKLRCIPIDASELFSILLRQALKHVFFAFILNLNYGLPWNVASDVAKSCCLSLLQTVGAFLMVTHKTFKVESSGMPLIKTVGLESGIGWHRRVSYVFNTWVFC